MNELAINIEYLLLTHDCVVVPSLGAFQAVQAAARWIARENLFLPPTRKVVFEPTITTDPEQILLHSLSDIYNISLEEAEERCKQMVSEFHKTLITDGTVDFGSIGIFSIEDDANIAMDSCECGVITPSYYGLDSLHIDLLNEEKAAAEEQPTIIIEEAEEVKIVKVEENKNYHSFRRSLFNGLMATAAIILLFFIVTPTQTLSRKESKLYAENSFLQPNMIDIPLEEEEYYYEEEATPWDSIQTPLTDITEIAKNEGVEHTQSIPKLAPKPENNKAALSILPTAKAEENKEVTKPLTTKQEDAKDVEQTSVNTGSQEYVIVLASSISRTNAQSFVEKLDKKGIKAKIHENGKMRRVVIDGFTSDVSARTRMSDIKSVHEDLRNAWILKL